MLFLVLGTLMDPVRLGMAAVLLSRRRALHNLLAFWAGGAVAGITIGIAVLVLLHDVALAAIQAGLSTINDVRSAVIIFTGGRLHITLAVLALAALATMLARERTRVTVPVLVGGGDGSDDAPPSGMPLPSRLSAHIHGMLESDFAWPAFVIGLTSTFPPLEGPMILTAIMASGHSTGVQFSAFLVFILLVLVFVEVPLIGYLAAPQKTQALMARLNAWIQVHRRQIVKTVLAVTGAMLLIKGVSQL